jgi:hypothetical protein
MRSLIHTCRTAQACIGKKIRKTLYDYWRDRFQQCDKENNACV